MQEMRHTTCLEDVRRKGRSGNFKSGVYAGWPTPPPMHSVRTTLLSLKGNSTWLVPRYGASQSRWTIHHLRPGMALDHINYVCVSRDHHVRSLPRWLQLR
jgi:hypothetical protein